MKIFSNYYLSKTGRLAFALFSLFSVGESYSYSYRETNIEIYLSNIKKLGKIKTEVIAQQDFIFNEIKEAETVHLDIQENTTKITLEDSVKPCKADKKVSRKISSILQNDKKNNLRNKKHDLAKGNNFENNPNKKSAAVIKNKVEPDFSDIPVESLSFTTKNLEVNNQNNEISASSSEKIDSGNIQQISEENQNSAELVKEIETLSQENKIENHQNFGNDPVSQENLSEAKGSHLTEDIIVNNLNNLPEEEINLPQQEKQKWYNHFFPKKKNDESKGSSDISLEETPETPLPSLPNNEQDNSSFASELIEEEININMEEKQSSVKITGDNSFLSMTCEKDLNDLDKRKIDNLIKNALFSRKQITVIAYNNSPENFKEEKNILEKLVEIREYLESNGLAADYINTKILSKENKNQFHDHKIINFYLI